MAGEIGALALPMFSNIIIPKSSVNRVRYRGGDGSDGKPAADPARPAEAAAKPTFVPQNLYQSRMFVETPVLNPLSEKPKFIPASLRRGSGSLLAAKQVKLIEKDDRLGIVRPVFAGLERQDEVYLNPENKELTIRQDSINFIG